MLTKRRLNLRRNMNDRLAVAPPPRGEPSTTKLPALLSGASSNSSSKFSNDLAGRFFTDNSFAAHSRDKEREVEREAQRKAKQRAKATQNRRRRLEKEMAKLEAKEKDAQRKRAEAEHMKDAQRYWAAFVADPRRSRSLDDNLLYARDDAAHPRPECWPNWS